MPLASFARVSFALFAAALSFTPIHLVLTGYSYPDFLHENVGFRFFWTMRWVDGAPDDFIHPGQGVLLPFIQSLYYVTAGGNLWERMTAFANLTAVGGAVTMTVLLLAIGLDRKLSPTAGLALLIAPVAMAIGHAHVISYHLFPDYHAYEKALLLCSAWVFVREFICDKPTPRSFVAMGVMAGLVAALKINLGPLVLLLAASQGPLLYFGVASAVAASTYAAMLMLYYGPHPGFILDYFAVLFHFSGGQWPFAWSDLSPFATWADHSMSNLGAYLLLSAALLFALARARPRLSIVIFLAMLLSFVMAVKRGGGGSYFDAVVVALTLIAIVAAALPAWLGRTVIALLALNVALSFHFNYGRITMPGTALNPPGHVWQRDLFNWNRNHGLPIYAIFPDNHYLAGTMEDMIMRGFSNFMRSWYEANDNPSRKTLFPSYTFGSYDLKIERPAVVEWVEAKRPFPFSDDIDAHNARMKEIAATFGNECLQVTPPASPYLTIHSCVVR